MFALRVIALVLLAIGTISCMWLGQVIDPYLESRKDKRYKKEWLEAWHASGMLFQRYITQYGKTRPTARIREKKANAFEWVFILLSIGFFIVWLVLTFSTFGSVSRTDHARLTALVCETIVGGLAIIICYYLVMSEAILPQWARQGEDYKPRIPLPTMHD